MGVETVSGKETNKAQSPPNVLPFQLLSGKAIFFFFTFVVFCIDTIMTPSPTID
jgi:hypothetical protein